MTVDYAKSIHLPKTDFPRRAGLAKKEPEILARWEKMGIYDRQRKESEGREKFILHMGPPFANGNIHLGHVLTTVLKDVVCRSYQMMGYDAPLVPGFDCHGLPIEWKIEEQNRAKGKNIDKSQSPVEFMKECREFAQGWVNTQSSEFQRLGVLADFKNPYLTMNPESEAVITQQVHSFLKSGSLYRGSKPVMWSIPEQTALAEAEIEYKDHTSDTVWVKFPVKSGPKELEGASVVIWTTTPWTLPGNRAVAYGAELNYKGIEVTAVGEGSLVQVGDKLLVLEDLYAAFIKSASITADKTFWQGVGASFEGMVCKHCLAGKGYEFDVPALSADFVTTDTGTGFVHIAPGHGEDDYRLGIKNGIEVPHTVAGDGKYLDHVPLFAGLNVYMPDGKKGPANKLVTMAIAENGNLVAKAQIQHSYPHSWRSKAPVIFRNTPQWFISMEKNDLRKKALAEIEKVNWMPAKGKNRIGGMVESRGDWCVSRQRTWGVPIAVFVNKKSGEPLTDEKVLNRIVEIFEKEGSIAWLARPAQDFLGADYKADDFEQVKDIIDVWFESASTHAFVLQKRPELRWPADLYLEGSDQHRGWFQSSLMVACGTKGTAPYKNVLTHGFILDDKGFKMSKSTGNVTSPIKLMELYGADILRLWVTGSDYTEDIKFGENILQGHVDVYRRIRNTFCYLLGVLNAEPKLTLDDLIKCLVESANNSTDANGDIGSVEFIEKIVRKPREDEGGVGVPYEYMFDLDRYVLHRLYEMDAVVRECIKAFDYQKMMTVLHNFCARDLSAFYFDVCKDTLYCDDVKNRKRLSVVTVLRKVFKHLVHWLSPVLCFTTEEAWLAYKGMSMEDTQESIHLNQMPEAPAQWKDETLLAKFDKIIAVRSVVTGALEVKRAEKAIGASLEAAPHVYADKETIALLRSVPFADICITSGLVLQEGSVPAEAFTLTDVPNVGVVFAKAEGDKCERCWKYTPEVGTLPATPTLCKRCGETHAVSELLQQLEKTAAAG